MTHKATVTLGGMVLNISYDYAPPDPSCDCAESIDINTAIVSELSDEDECLYEPGSQVVGLLSEDEVASIKEQIAELESEKRREKAERQPARLFG